MAIVTAKPSMKYLARMMTVLVAHDELTVTSLAMLSRMNHKRCRTLLMWMLDSGFARTRLLNHRRYIALTQAGIEYAKRVQELNDMTKFQPRPAYRMYVQNVNELYKEIS